MQKQLGMAAQGWRMADALERCARSLQWNAQLRADIHSEAAADARKALAAPLCTLVCRNEVPDVARDHEYLAKKYFAIAGAHHAVVARAKAQAGDYATMLINKLTPEMVKQRLSALETAMAATILRRFGGNLADARTRARVFEACDFAQWEGGVDEIAMTKHEGISSTREFV